MLAHLLDGVARYGYAAVFVLIAVEYMAIPLPGETALVAAAVLAGQGKLDIFAVVAVAAAAAICGGAAGFWVGRIFGLPLALRYGRYLHLDEGRLKIAQYFFRLHGGKIVLFGRFVALLRALAAFLAGANQYGWPRFLFYNALGGVLWAALFGAGGYFLGVAFETYAKPVAFAALVAAVVGFVAVSRALKSQEPAWRAKAEAALPGPLEGAGGR